MADPSEDLWVPPGPGVSTGLSVPATDLQERFSRSSGPGGQSVNTTDSRVELSLDLTQTGALSAEQRERALRHFGDRLQDGRLVVVASEHRSQLRNRMAARERLAKLLRLALTPPPPRRRASRPGPSAQRRRLEQKRQRSELKRQRRQPDRWS